jgi:hypothetical protein
MRTDDDIVSSLVRILHIRTLSAADSQWHSSPQAISYALNLAVRGVMMGLPTPVPRSVAKTTTSL